MTGAALTGQGPSLGPVPLEFVLFAAVLAGIALFHARALTIALAGAAAVAACQVGFAPGGAAAGAAALAAHLGHEWVTLVNLLLLLVGFALLAGLFEQSGLPARLPKALPEGWHGCFVLLAMVFVLSSFLDNIAAAMIGGGAARVLFRGRVHIGYVAAIVAAANAGGAGSVIGDTTTTMMWIAGIHPLEVMEAAAGAVAVLLVCGIPASLQQQAHAGAALDAAEHAADIGAWDPIDWGRVAIVTAALAAAVAVNVSVSRADPALGAAFPWLGAVVCGVIAAGAVWRRPDVSLLPGAARGAVFLVSLVFTASLMPVQRLPPASWQTTLALGFVSAVFDNIPLTALALRQGGYDWGFLAYAVGVGGSMIWFGSSAGVALAGVYPQARSVGQWLRHGWHVPLAYVAGFAVMLATLGYHPGPPPRAAAAAIAPTPTPVQETPR